MKDLMDRPISERYDHLYATISSERFLKMQGIGKEVPFFICPFRPHEFPEMSKFYDPLVRKLRSNGIDVLKINLYDLTVEILKERGIFDEILEREPSISKEELKELLQSVLDPERHLIPAIAKKMEKATFDVMFITGVGEVFPYIRSHTILNNLQRVAKDKPTVMFFPGEYQFTEEKGTTLNLFGRLHDDKYYRAFNIYHFQI